MIVLRMFVKCAHAQDSEHGSASIFHDRDLFDKFLLDPVPRPNPFLHAILIIHIIPKVTSIHYHEIPSIHNDIWIELVQVSLDQQRSTNKRVQLSPLIATSL